MCMFTIYDDLLVATYMCMFTIYDNLLVATYMYANLNWLDSDSVQ